jgi:pimeloyl-ACP methyl ester carboxylesterase
MQLFSTVLLSLAATVVAGIDTTFKVYNTSNGVTYSYISQKPSNSSKPTILFLHGFPDSVYGWESQIDYFTKQGYGFIAPELLGYGGTCTSQSFPSLH